MAIFENESNKYTMILSENGIKTLPAEMQEEISELLSDLYSAYRIEVEFNITGNTLVADESYWLRIFCTLIEKDGTESSIELYNRLTDAQTETLAREMLSVIYKNITSIMLDL